MLHFAVVLLDVESARVGGGRGVARGGYDRSVLGASRPARDPRPVHILNPVALDTRQVSPSEVFASWRTRTSAAI